MVTFCLYLGFLCERKLIILSHKEYFLNDTPGITPITSRKMTFEQCSSECDKIEGEIFNKNDYENMLWDNLIISITISAKL